MRLLPSPPPCCLADIRVAHADNRVLDRALSYNFRASKGLGGRNLHQKQKPAHQVREGLVEAGLNVIVGPDQERQHRWPIVPSALPRPIEELRCYLDGGIGWRNLYGRWGRDWSGASLAVEGK